MLPVRLKVLVGLVPNGYTLGISKITRTVFWACKKFALQEDITKIIADRLWNVSEGYGPESLIVASVGDHFCEKIRGIRYQSHTTMTELRGCIDDNILGYFEKRLQGVSLPPRYKLWRELSAIHFSNKELRKVLQEFAKKLGVLYFNVGFIHEDILRICPGLDRILQFPVGNNSELGETLNNLFEALKNNPELFLYNLVKEKGYFEIPELDRLNEVIKDIKNEEIKERYQELWKKWESYYLTVYYGNVFVLDSLVIAEKGGNYLSSDNIDYIKGSLQYLAGYLMYQIGIYHALRSAVAAIMARNMSHNIGSHVLNYLSDPEEIDGLWVI